MIDALFINPNSSAKAYQDLALTYSAIEPPTWALLLAQACRAKGLEVAILDCDAERLNLETSLKRKRRSSQESFTLWCTVKIPILERLV